VLLEAELVPDAFDPRVVLTAWVLAAHVDGHPVPDIPGDAGDQVTFERQKLATVRDGVTKIVESLQQSRDLLPAAKGRRQGVPVFLNDRSHVGQLAVRKFVGRHGAHATFTAFRHLDVAALAPLCDALIVRDPTQPLIAVCLPVFVRHELPERVFAGGQG
jgi:hypothetical protein